MTNFKLTYFDGDGLGEPVRLLLHYGKIEFEDKRVDFFSEWSNMKISTPLGQLPLLEVDGKVLHQSLAIGRFLAKKVGLYSDDATEAYEIDNVIDIVNDFKTKVADAHYETDEEVKKKKWIPVRSEVIPFFLNKLEIIAEANDGHLALNRLTWADIYFTGLITYMKFIMEEDSSDLKEKYPNLRKVVKNVKNQDGIREWIERKPKSDW